MPQGIWTYAIRLTAQELLCQITERQTGAQPSKFSGTNTQYLLGRDEEIFGDLCIFLAMCTKTYRIIQEERAVDMHNLRFVPKFRDFFSCRPAKYTRLPVQQVKTREKQFPFVKFDVKYKA